MWQREESCACGADGLVERVCDDQRGFAQDGRELVFVGQAERVGQQQFIIRLHWHNGGEGQSDSCFQGAR